MNRIWVITTCAALAVAVIAWAAEAGPGCGTGRCPRWNAAPGGPGMGPGSGQGMRKGRRGRGRGEAPPMACGPMQGRRGGRGDPGRKGSGGPGRGRRGPRMGHGLGFLGRCREQLGITDKQMETIRKTLAGSRDKMRAQGEKVHEARRGLAEAVMAGDEAKIRAAGAQLGKVLAEGGVLASKMQAEARKALTPEQNKKLDELRKKACAMRDRLRKAREGFRKVMEAPTAPTADKK